LAVWWDGSPPGTTTVRLVHPDSNIHPADYAGPESCRDCHKKNYQGWSQHPHRWMNALARPQTVKGDFSPEARISYLGGQATFREHEDGYRMLLARGATRRLYAVSQTIGSRFFQYYVGKLLEGPEPDGHRAYVIDQVLPFGYWLDRQEWVPVVHVGLGETPDGEREDPFAPHALDVSFSPYYECNSCHTTFALGDELARNFWALGRHAPVPLHWSLPDYLGGVRDDLLIPGKRPAEYTDQEVQQLLVGMQMFAAPEHAVKLGVTCESCHLGCQQHAAGKLAKPSFFPHSPHLRAEAAAAIDPGPTHENVNWACGRCHAGQRPYFAAGMATWNSTEYTDAMKGSCYSQLRCVDCHNPHQATGPQWTRTAAEDDASCVRCHQQFATDEALAAHTHHSAGSTGSRCMNCHMPRLNEGLQNVVRTHMIFSPTNRQMIEANQPNACNLCHVDQSIDWTLTHLRQWYGATYDDDQLVASYPRRDEPAVIGWLKHRQEAVRLVATDAVARSGDRRLLPALIDLLDDPYLLNRQFARIGLESMLEVRLLDYGYRFYMTPQERREPITRLRARLLPSPQPAAADQAARADASANADTVDAP
jgi:predicted CXXCH cytochrome family protein